MNGKLLSKLAIALFLLVLSVGFVSSFDEYNETFTASAGEGASQPLNTANESDSSSNDTNNTQDGGKTTVNTYDKATGNPFLALVVVIVCLVLVRYRN
ncbi:hypothetical protein [Methanobrevibacter sp.]|jgi:ABC-type oligopeptide transport system substrate-binding subunit|uniref:hypothetical protein n=1 Tax=Methanobrevibacter sp. TaxID=66852 RepID=UPI003868ED38